MRTFSPDVRM